MVEKARKSKSEPLPYPSEFFLNPGCPQTHLHIKNTGEEDEKIESPEEKCGGSERPGRNIMGDRCCETQEENSRDLPDPAGIELPDGASRVNDQQKKGDPPQREEEIQFVEEKKWR